MARPTMPTDLRRVFEVLLTVHQRGASDVESLAKEFGFSGADRLEGLLRGFGDIDLAPIDPVSWEVFVGDDEPGELHVAPGTVQVEAAHPLFATPPRLTVAHALMILSGLQAVADLGDPELSRAADSLGRKLRDQVVRTASPAARVLLDSLLIPPDDDGPQAELVSALRKAAGRHRARLGLWSDDDAADGGQGNGGVVTVVVDPVSVVADDGRTYLHAYDAQNRVFAAIPMYRVVSVEILDEPTETPRRVPPFDRRAPLPGMSAQEPITVRLRLAAAAAWVPEYYDCTVLERHDDGSFTLELTAPSRQWLVRFLRRLGRAAAVERLD